MVRPLLARTHCAYDDSGKFICATADCGSGLVACNGAGGIPPAPLIEFTLAEYSGQDFHDLSLVDGFSLPLSITPQGGYGNCMSTICPNNINAACPSELSLKGADGDIIACKSACLAFNQPQYCCTGEFAPPDKCPPSSYSQMFKKQCPQGYSYAYDSESSTFTCTGGANYVITFCP